MSTEVTSVAPLSADSIGGIVDTWIQQDSTILPVEDVWKFCMGISKDAEMQKIDDFLPIDENIKAWFERFSVNHLGVSFSLSSHLSKYSNTMLLDDGSNKRSHARQSLMMVIRFLSFAVKHCFPDRTSFSNEELCLMLQIPKVVIGFLTAFDEM